MSTMTVDTKKVYVVLELDWEFNDEYYYRSGYGDGGGRPTKSYGTLEAAKTALVEMTYKSLTSSGGLGLWDFLGEDGLRNIVHTDKGVEFLKELYPDHVHSIEHESYDLAAMRLSMEPFREADKEKVLDFIKNDTFLELYEICEIEHEA